MNEDDCLLKFPDAREYFNDTIINDIEGPLREIFSIRLQYLRNSIHFIEYIDARAKYWREHDDRKSITYNADNRHKKCSKERVTDDTANFFLKVCYAMMIELLTDGPMAWRHNFQSVLDLCCAPGGFAKALLEKFPSCYIDGATLPVEDGGSQMIFSHRHLRVLLHDVITLARKERLPFRGVYDLVNLGGAWAVDYSTDDVEDVPTSDGSRWERLMAINLRLKVAEMVIMVQYLRPGGCAVVRSPFKKANFTGTVLWLLLAPYFQRIVPFRPSEKSSSMLWSHGFVYLVCMNFKRKRSISEERSYLLSILDEIENHKLNFVKTLFNKLTMKQMIEEEQPVWKKLTNCYRSKISDLQFRSKRNLDF